MAKINYEVVTCSKCNGSGEYIYRSGIVGHCYPCNGSGKLKRYTHKQFLIRISDNSGIPFDWLNVKARTEAEAIKKARKIAKKARKRTFSHLRALTLFLWLSGVSAGHN